MALQYVLIPNSQIYHPAASSLQPNLLPYTNYTCHCTTRDLIYVIAQPDESQT